MDVRHYVLFSNDKIELKTVSKEKLQYLRNLWSGNAAKTVGYIEVKNK